MAKHKTLVIMPDVHAPYHDRGAWKRFLRCLEVIKPDIFVNIGDFIDSHAMSRHVKDPRREALFRKELILPRRMLRELDDVLPQQSRRLWTMGNHDIWMERRVAEKMPELEGIFTIDNLLDLSEHGWEVTPYGQSVKVGKLNLSHDYGYSGANAGRSTLLAVGDNAVFGHSHRASVTYGGTALGVPHVSMNVGWLGDKKAATYAHQTQKNRDWMHGFGMAYLMPNGNAHCHFVPFIGGKAVIPTAVEVVS